MLCFAGLEEVDFSGAYVKCCRKRPRFLVEAICSIVECCSKLNKLSLCENVIVAEGNN